MRLRTLTCTALILGLSGCAQGEISPPEDPPEHAPGWADEERAILAEDGYRLPYRRWGPDADSDPPPRDVLLALHGLNDYSKGMEKLGEYMAEQGVATYAYDHRGFGATADAGTWPGATTLIDDAATVFELLQERYPESRHFLLGHSMGGAIALTVTVEQNPSIDGLALLAPAVWGREAMPWYQRTALWLTSRILPGLKLSGEVIGVDPTDNEEAVEQMHADPLIQRTVRADKLAGVTDLMDRALQAVEALEKPSLILYGEHDEVVPPEPTCVMLQRLPDRPPGRWRFALYPEGYHLLTRDLQRERVLADLAAWIEAPEDARLPSSNETGRDEALSRLCNRR